MPVNVSYFFNPQFVMFMHLLADRPSLLLGAVRSLSARRLHIPGAQLLVSTVARLPCLQCGLQTSLPRLRSTDMNDILAERVDCGKMRLPLACSKECADKVEETKVEVLALYDSMVEDIQYAAAPEASKLFSEVLQPTRRVESNKWGGDRQLTSWKDFLKLHHPSEHWLNDPRALRLLSSAYSYVMTLSRFLPELMDTKKVDSRQTFKLHVIGARAEAMMPCYLWDEVSFFHPGRHFDIKLVGDHVPVLPVRKKASTAKEDGKGRLVHLQMVNGLYHKIDPRKLGTPDAFVLYNSGVGHPRLRKSWEPTLQTVLKSCKPVLMTSFSKEDQQRDIAALQNLVASSPLLQQHELRFRCRAKTNSFRSLKYQIDPSDVSTPISTNNRVMVVQLAAVTEKRASVSTQTP